MSIIKISVKQFNFWPSFITFYAKYCEESNYDNSIWKNYIDLQSLKNTFINKKPNDPLKIYVTIFHKIYNLQII